MRGSPSPSPETESTPMSKTLGLAARLGMLAAEAARSQAQRSPKPQAPRRARGSCQFVGASSGRASSPSGRLRSPLIGGSVRLGLGRRHLRAMHVQADEGEQFPARGVSPNLAPQVVLAFGRLPQFAEDLGPPDVGRTGSSVVVDQAYP